MTDLISSLADSLVALNNASPRLPTKQQIEEVLRKGLLDDGSPMLSTIMVVAYGGKGELCPPEPVKVKWSAPNDFTNWAPTGTDLNEASLEAAISQIQSLTMDRGTVMTQGSPGTEGDAAAGGLSSLMPLPYKDPSPAMMQLLDEQRAGLQRIATDLVTGIKEDEQARGYWDAQERNAHKLLGYTGPTTKKKLEAARARREAYEIYWANKLNEPFDNAANPCPRLEDHPDGQHRWHAFDKNGVFCEPGASWDASHGARKCICGAYKLKL